MAPYVIGIKRVGTPAAGLAPARETIVFDEAAFRIVDEPDAVSLGPEGSQTTGRSRVSLQSIAPVAARIRYNTGTSLFEIVRGYGVASVTAVGGGARVTFATPMPDALYAPFVSPVRNDTPGNVVIPYDTDPHAAYCDCFFIDETQTPVLGSFLFRVDLAS